MLASLRLFFKEGKLEYAPFTPYLYLFSIYALWVKKSCRENPHPEIVFIRNDTSIVVNTLKICS